MTQLPDVPEVTPLELVRAIETGSPLQIVDVRATARVQSGHIDLVPASRFHNIVGSELRARTDLAGTGIDPAQRTVVVCGKGNDSRLGAAHLISLGANAVSLKGGMAAYMDLLVERRFEPPHELDHLLQFDRIGKGSLAYLLVSDGEALVVDPPRDTVGIEAAARAAGARIVGVADTHVHADYISGAPALSAALGVPYFLHPADHVYPYDGTPGKLAITPLKDGMRLHVGRATFTVLHTPGHTLGQCSFLLDDVLVLSGDFVLVDSLGRPDLAGHAGEWAELLWTSLEHARHDWPKELLVLPAHYSNAKERRADHSVAGLFGDLMKANQALALSDRTAFMAWATAKASVPENYKLIKAVNAGLKTVTPAEATDLEVGRNECAVVTTAH